MREILFRGKRANGDWYYGSYLYLNVPARDWKGNVRGKPEPVHYIVDEKDVNYAVDPATVGQYTGLTDKNGKKIFENDIVVVRYDQSDGQIEQEVKRVHYNSKECCWYPMRWDEHCDFCDNWTEILSLEVIGNIHDNSDLLKEG